MNEGTHGRRLHRSSQGTDSRASSAVIGSLLLVAVVLVLAGTTLLLGQSLAPNPSETDRASFSFRYAPSGNQDTLTITHDGGDRLAGDRIAVVVTGASPPGVDGTYDWTGASLDGDGTVQSGDSVTLGTETIGDASRLDLDSASIRVQLQSPETTRSFILARWTGPDYDGSEPGPATSAEAVTTIEESETIGGDRKVYFHIDSVQQVTIVDFAVETANEGTMSDVETIGGTGNDIVIEPSGAYSEGWADGKGSGYATDGTVYALDENATVGADGRANITVSEFINEDGTTYTFNAGDPEFTTQAGPWDLAITLGFRDGTDVTFYLDVPDGG